MNSLNEVVLPRDSSHKSQEYLNKQYLEWAAYYLPMVAGSYMKFWLKFKFIDET